MSSAATHIMQGSLHAELYTTKTIQWTHLRKHLQLSRRKTSPSKRK
jgi:hypothetical protein